MTEEEAEKHFKRLREHLNRVLPNIEEFCKIEGYEFANPKSLGRYPRIRIIKNGDINRWIELWAENDENGRRYEEFFEEIPYELSAGASFTITKREDIYRVSKIFALFNYKEFKDIPSIITEELNKANEQLSTWDRSYLISEGEIIKLDR